MSRRSVWISSHRLSRAQQVASRVRANALVARYPRKGDAVLSESDVAVESQAAIAGSAGSLRNRTEVCAALRRAFISATVVSSSRFA